jgi:tetratricopeptide (TPR) repeat protein
MIDELLETVARHRSDAQDFRRMGRKQSGRAKRNQLFRAAAADFEKAITVLEQGLRAVRRRQDGYTQDICRLLEALSQSYGSLGGTWRDARDYKKSIKLYDKGNDYEEERRRNCYARDTYNMLQRLIVRLLAEPALLTRPDFIKELNTVRREIQSQVDAGRDDSWALADLALARFLCGVDAEGAIADLERGKAEATFYESTYSVVAALVDEGMGKGAQLGDGLKGFKALLRRKGGLP